MTIVVAVIAFVIGVNVGVVLMAVMAASGTADKLGAHLPNSASPPDAAAGAENAAAQISDRLVRDFHVVTDHMGVEHVIPIDAPTPGA